MEGAGDKEVEERQSSKMEGGRGMDTEQEGACESSDR